MARRKDCDKYTSCTRPTQYNKLQNSSIVTGSPTAITQGEPFPVCGANLGKNSSAGSDSFVVMVVLSQVSDDTSPVPRFADFLRPACQRATSRKYQPQKNITRYETTGPTAGLPAGLNPI